MAEEKRTETMIPQEDSKEAAEVMGFMAILDAKFMKNLSAGAIKTA